MAISQHWTVISIFDDQDTAKKAMEELLQAEFTPEQVECAMRDTGQVVSMERFQHIGIDEQQDHILPVTDDGIPETSTANNIEDEATQEVHTIAQTPQTEEDEAIQERQMIAQTAETPDLAMHDGDETAEPDDMQNDAETSVDAADTEDDADISSKRENEATGAITGGIVGGVVGIVTGLLLPFISPAIAGGANIVALGGATMGAIAGGFLGTLVGIGVPEEPTRQHEQEFKTGRTIVTVKTDDRQQDALHILQRNGAIYANAHGRGF